MLGIYSLSNFPRLKINLDRARVRVPKSYALREPCDFLAREPRILQRRKVFSLFAHWKNKMSPVPSQVGLLIRDHGSSGTENHAPGLENIR